MCIREQGLPEKKETWNFDNPKIVLHKKVINECPNIKEKNHFAILYRNEIEDNDKEVHEFPETDDENRLIIVATKLDLCKKYEVISYLFH